MTWKRTAYFYGKSSDEEDWFVEKREIIARAATEEEAERMVEELERKESQCAS